jgi:hypothetical protein
MPYLPSPTYNPSVTPVPVLDASSGDPTAKKDPKSVASIGSNIQAMQDQAAADRLFDAPVKEGFTGKPEGFTGKPEGFTGKPEGFTKVNPSGLGKPEGFTKVNPSGLGKPESFADYASPWITQSQACKRIQGFTDMNLKEKPKPLPYLAAAIAFTAAAVILSSFL